MERLDSQVRTELSRMGGVEGDLSAIVQAWPAAVGAVLARNAWPARLQRDGTLLVHAVSSTWAFELGAMAAEILERLRAEAAEAAPPALRFVPGPVPEPTADRPAEASVRPLEILPADAAAGAALATAVDDDELRRLIARAAAASLARARAEAGSGRGF